ncbi:hypothetical protein OKW46_002556 [Paraburkholderia sp. WSM4179]|nr:hypothetical protein [Paraburkholderia sp. WSM4179]
MKANVCVQLWLSLLARFACLTAITGYDVWLLRRLHRTAWVPDHHHPIVITECKP